MEPRAENGDPPPIKVHCRRCGGRLRLWRKEEYAKRGVDIYCTVCARVYDHFPNRYD